MKLLHLTDIHITPGALVPSLPHLPHPSVCLRRCVNHILTHHADADLCLVTGDLTQNGDDASYVALRAELGRLPMPVVPLMGNHDDLPALRRAFPEIPLWEGDSAHSEPDALQYVVEGRGLRLLCLDTSDPDRKAGGDGNGGLLRPERLAWLEARLKEDSLPVILAMHHHPLPLGMPFMDNLALENSAALAALLARYPHVRHLCFGHVHRDAAGTWAGVSFSTPGSAALPVCLDAEHTDRIALSDVSPAYGLLRVDVTPSAFSLVAHRVPFMPEEAWMLP